MVLMPADEILEAREEEFRRRNSVNVSLSELRLSRNDCVSKSKSTKFGVTT